MKEGELKARAAFANYTQSIAFSMTLSRTMIEGLQLVRDYGFPHVSTARIQKDIHDRLKEREKAFSVFHPRVESHFVPMISALIRRGLVWHDYPVPKGLKDTDRHDLYKLTRAGELMCELLVEAGLISKKKRSAA